MLRGRMGAKGVRVKSRPFARTVFIGAEKLLSLCSMSEYIVSARKYRPDSFETLIGQDTIARTLSNSIRRGQLAHAYLFCGPRGVGKTTTARIFAKMINCMNPGADMEPCGQ